VQDKTAVIDSKFRFILIAAKRARQLQSGAKAMIHTVSRKPTRIAQEEVRAGTVEWELIPLVIPVEPEKGETTKKSKK
jgi:DNA-directed RNA polymerase omega subunit